LGCGGAYWAKSSYSPRISEILGGAWAPTAHNWASPLPAHGVGPLLYSHRIRIQRLKFKKVSYQGVANVRILIKNKLQNPLVIRETNLLSIINQSLAHVYCSTTLSKYGLIRLKNFVSQNSLNLCI
jgi:hypothetical protein